MTQQQQQQPDKRFNRSFHHVGLVVVIISGFVLGSMFNARNSLPIAMLEMVNRTYLVTTVYPNSTTDNVLGEDYIERGEFSWSNEMQQIMLLAYMVSYTLPQLPLTRISLKYGLRTTISLWMLLEGSSCFLVPWLARYDWKWMLLLRFLQGIGAAPLLPALMAAIEIWIPKEHCASALALQQFLFMSMYLFVPLVNGYLAAIHWEWCFRSSALLCFFFSSIWWLVSRNTPESCPFISQKELDKIKASKSEESGDQSSSNYPWYFMLRVRSFYFFALTYSMFAAVDGALVALMPTYFRKMMQFSTQDNGFHNFLIQIGINFSVLWPQPVIMALQKYFDLSLTAARRIVVVLYTSVSFFTLGYIALYHQHQIGTLILFKFVFKASQWCIMATMMSQFGDSGTSGLVFSLVNTIANMSASFVCWTAGYYLDVTGESVQCWSWIFGLMAATNPVMLIIYFCFLKSEPVKLNLKHSDLVKA